MEKNYYDNTSVCLRHNSPNIVGYCGKCGTCLCEKCSLSTPYGRRLCPDCFQIEYTTQLNELNNMKRTMKLYIALGGIPMALWWGHLLYDSIQKYNASSFLEKTKLALIELYMYSNESIIKTLLWLCFPIVALFILVLLGAGFIFGLRKVINKIRGFYVVGSWIFIILVFGLILQIAWIIGVFVMISEYIKIHKKKKVIGEMEAI